LYRVGIELFCDRQHAQAKAEGFKAFKAH